MLDVNASPRMERILSRAAEIGKIHTGAPFVGTEKIMSSENYRTPSTKVHPTPRLSQKTPGTTNASERMDTR